MWLRNLPPLVRGIIIAYIASAVLSLILPTLAVWVLPLYPALLLRGLQIWRLVTYPFFFGISIHNLLWGIVSLVWTGMIVSMFGGELETIVHTRRLTTALAVSVVIGGILFALLSPNDTLAGSGMITMFMLAGFAYMWPKREISVFGLFWVKAWIIALIFFLLSIIPMNGMQLDTSASNLFGPFFGAVSAIVYFHTTYRQYSFGRGFLNKMEHIVTSKQATAKRMASTQSVEQRIDSILDKIAKSGMGSLSKDEREFLLRNSK